MNDLIYIIDITDIINEINNAKLDAVIEKYFFCLTDERIDKLKSTKTTKRQAEIIGSSLLLCSALIQLDCGWLEIEKSNFRLEDLREKLKFSYNQYGKPYFKEIPIFFNISHSKNLIACAVSKEEIGIDIQLNQGYKEKIAARFFCDAEISGLKVISSTGLQEECEQAFYRLWASKEAFGKLLGDGLPNNISKDFSCVIDKFVSCESKCELQNFQVHFLDKLCRWEFLDKESFDLSVRENEEVIELEGTCFYDTFNVDDKRKYRKLIVGRLEPKGEIENDSYSIAVCI